MLINGTAEPLDADAAQNGDDPVLRDAPAKPAAPSKAPARAAKTLPPPKNLKELE
jgi:hypothetical protein